MNQPHTEVTRERLFDEFNAVVAETERLLKSLATAGSDQAGTIKASVQQGLTAASDRLAKIREQSVQQAGAAAKATDEYVRDNPWQSIGVVAAVSAIVGLICGLLIARR